MGRGIKVNFGGEVTEFDITKVEREKLYGRKMRLIVDEQGTQCKAAMLSRDGSVLMPPGCIASLYVDEQFDTVEREDLQAVDVDGKPIARVPSTLGVEQELKGPVETSRLLDHVVMSVYELSYVALGEKLKAGLDAGGIFELPFNYREDFAAETAFLLKNDLAVFALICTPTRFEFLKRSAAVLPSAEAADEGDDDLDFSMM